MQNAPQTFVRTIPSMIVLGVGVGLTNSDAAVNMQNAPQTFVRTIPSMIVFGEICNHYVQYI